MRKSLIPHFLSLLHLSEGLYGNIRKTIQEAVVAPGCKQRAKLKRNVLFCEDVWWHSFQMINVAGLLGQEKNNIWFLNCRTSP